jgi:hypothetical protein
MASAARRAMAAHAKELAPMRCQVLFLKALRRNAMSKKTSAAEPHAIGNAVVAAANAMAKVVNIEVSGDTLAAMLCRFLSMRVLYVGKRIEAA